MTQRKIKTARRLAKRQKHGGSNPTPSITVDGITYRIKRSLRDLPNEQLVEIIRRWGRLT